VFSVNGTIGQHGAGAPMTGGNFSLTGGFWSIIAVPTPGAPLLSIGRTATNTGAIFWPSPAPGFTLQENTNLALPSAWSPVAQLAVTNGAQISITVPASVARKFFRLKSL